MNYDLLELEHLVMTHDNCNLKQCKTCKRIKELRKIVTDDSVDKFMLTNLETGEKKKFKAAAEACKFLKIGSSTFNRMLKTGDEYKNYVADRLFVSKSRGQGKRYVYYAIDERGKESRFDSMREVAAFLGVHNTYISIMVNEQISKNGYVVFREEVEKEVLT